MQIRELSARTGVSERSLRYYEHKGILFSTRLENGYRDFDMSQIERVKAIQFYLGLGLNTEQVERILNCRGPQETVQEESFCEELLSLYEQKLEHIQGDIESLREVESRLEERISWLQTMKSRSPVQASQEHVRR